MKKNCLFFVLITLLVLFLMPTSIAETAPQMDISEFDAAQYVTGEAETVDIYAGLSFGMFPEQATVEAKKAGISIEKNPYTSDYDLYTPSNVLVEEYYEAELHYNFDDKGEYLYQLVCSFNSPRDKVYNDIEKILTEKYGETSYTSETGNSIGEMSFAILGRTVCSTDKCTPYSQRVVKLADGTYVIIEHYVWNDFWPLHYLNISIVNPK